MRWYIIPNTSETAGRIGPYSDTQFRGKVLLVYFNSKLSDIGYIWDVYVNPHCN